MRSAQVHATAGSDPTGNLVRPEGDFFATSPAATEALLKVEAFRGTIWEPACGDGRMAEVLRRASGVTHVHATDLYDRGYGVPGQDFLRCPAMIGIDNVVTNPPFNLVEEFIQHALALNPHGKIAIFARLALLEGRRRYETLWKVRPPTRVWVFPSRPELARNGGEYQTGLIAFAWFVWHYRRQSKVPQLGWLA